MYNSVHEKLTSSHPFQGILQDLLLLSVVNADELK